MHLRSNSKWLRQVGAWLVCALAATTPFDVQAAGFVGTSASTPVEERIAVAVSGSRSTAFFQLRVESQGGPFAIVVPVDDGAALDWSSRAFFEALEGATAPRVLAPEAIDATCAPSEVAAAHVFGDLDGTPPLEPTETAVLDGSAAVEVWATERSLSISEDLAAVMASEDAGTRFFVAKFDAPEGTYLTKTLRVVGPSLVSSLPLAYARSGSSPLRIVSFSIGAGRALPSGTPVQIDASNLALKAADETSNYADLLSDAFQGAPTAPYLLDMTSHQSLAVDVSLGEDGPDAQAFLHGYFDRAAVYGETRDQPSSCIEQATAVLSQSLPVGTTCPRADLGVVGGLAPCASDTFGPGVLDPSLLRCGRSVDDLAIVLSDLEPDEAWLTRATFLLPPATSGISRSVTFPGGARIDPALHAGSVDLTGCDTTGQGGSGEGGAGDEGGGAINGPGANGTSSGGNVVDVPIYSSDGCTCDGAPAIVGYVEESESEAPDAYYVDDCSGDSSGSYDEYDADDCSGETSGSGEFLDDGCSSESYDSAGDGCSGESDGGDACSGDSASGDACSGDSGADDLCSGDGADEACAVRPVNGASRRRGRLSPFVYGALALIVPIRRLTRRRVASRANG
ncbi:MAG: DUF2330 domain-containing protein [Polyangiaceae bacterium]|nr:DUF2330 domain-containing protein [Polyangiaceae bacterium]